PATYTNIANTEIQTRRASTAVPHKGGNLHDYVPFYFSNRSPMLYSIYRSGISQSDIVYLVSTLPKVDSENAEWVFTDGHPIVAYSTFYEDVSDLDEVDWDIINDKYWENTEEDPNRKTRKQAEFLV